MILSFKVASFTGAWIETINDPDVLPSESVASFTGAWIETYSDFRFTGCTESHPLRVRGLKHDRMIIEMKEEYVASFTGAWIETYYNLFQRWH